MSREFEVSGPGRGVRLECEASWVLPEGFRREVKGGDALLDRAEDVCLVSV